MSGDDEVEPEGAGPDAAEEVITYWVQQGMALGIRAVGFDLDVAIGGPCAEIVAAMASTIAACEGLEGAEFPLAFLYQREMEWKTKGGFDLAKVPTCFLPGVDVLQDGANGWNPARAFDRARSCGMVGDVDPETMRILLEGGDGEEDGDDALQEAWDDFVSNASIVDSDGVAWSVFENDDVFLVPPWMEWSDGDEQYLMMPGGSDARWQGKHVRDDGLLVGGKDSPSSFGRRIAALAMGLRRDRMTKESVFLDDHTRLGELVNRLNIVPFTLTYGGTANGRDDDELAWEGDPHLDAAPIRTFAGNRKRLR